jgi:hypothetical protein
MNTITIIENSPLTGKILKVNYRPNEAFMITNETLGGGVTALCSDGNEYYFNLSDDVEILNK